MSTTGTDRPTAARLDETAAIPTVPVRRSILHPAPAPAQAGPTPFSYWRGRAVTEELAAVPAPSRSNRHARRSPIPRHPLRRTRIRRHLRCALVGTLLAVVAVTGLSAYAAAGIDARSTALCQAHLACNWPPYT